MTPLPCNLRNRTLGTLVGLGVLLSAGAAHASTITFTWLSTSGSGVGVGTATLVGMAPSDTAVLEMRVTVSTPGTGLWYVGGSATYNPSVVVATAIEMCPGGAGTGNEFAPACGALATSSEFPGGLLNPVPPTDLNAVGGQGAFTGGQAHAGVEYAGQLNGADFVLAHITFSVVGVGTTGGFFSKPSVGGESTIGSLTLNPIANPGNFSVTAVPEAETIALLALGVGALAFASRRRQREG